MASLRTVAVTTQKYPSTNKYWLYTTAHQQFCFSSSKLFFFFKQLLALLIFLPTGVWSTRHPSPDGFGQHPELYLDFEYALAPFLEPNSLQVGLAINLANIS